MPTWHVSQPGMPPAPMMHPMMMQQAMMQPMMQGRAVMQRTQLVSSPDHSFMTAQSSFLPPPPHSAPFSQGSQSQSESPQYPPQMFHPGSQMAASLAPSMLALPHSDVTGMQPALALGGGCAANPMADDDQRISTSYRTLGCIFKHGLRATIPKD